jgi:hypothetical protein
VTTALLPCTVTAVALDERLVSGRRSLGAVILDICMTLIWALVLMAVVSRVSAAQRTDDVEHSPPSQPTDPGIRCKDFASSRAAARQKSQHGLRAGRRRPEHG